MKRVLLTGASGFVGRHCLSALAARGYEVHAVSSRTQAATAPPAGRWHKADLLDSGQISALLAGTKISPEQLERDVMRELGLQPWLVSSQVASRLQDYWVLVALNEVAAPLAKLRPVSIC